MKVAVIGAGSTYTPEVIWRLIEYQDLPVNEVSLMDINQDRLEVVGGFIERMVEAKGSPFKVSKTLDQQEAISGADFVLTQIRVGGMEARLQDELLGRRYELIGQETTGIGGMAKALRTIPVILSVAEDMKQYAKGAYLINFTNPSGLVTEALFQHAPDVNSVGLCNLPIIMEWELLQQLNHYRGLERDAKIQPERVQIDMLGLNHLSWVRDMYVDGKSVWDEVLNNLMKEFEQSSDKPGWDISSECRRSTVEALRMIPVGYLEYYWSTREKLATQASTGPRAEKVMEVDKRSLEEYKKSDGTELPQSLQERGGFLYSTAAVRLMNDIHTSAGRVHVVNVRHDGKINRYDPKWVMELSCKVDSDGISPVSGESLPVACQALLYAVKAYELLTVKAAVDGDRNAAYQALLAHPLGPSDHQINRVLDDMLTTNRPYLHRFFKE